MTRVRGVIATVVLAGSGGAVGIATATSGAAPPSRVGVGSIVCSASGSSSSHLVRGGCTYVLTDGRRYRCPLASAHRRQTPASLAHTPSCRPLKPIFIPRAWRRVFARLYAVRECLARRGITAHGGPTLDANGGTSAAPIGELFFSKTFLVFYASARTARRAEPRLLQTARGTGGQVERHGLVTAFWVKPPSRSLRSATEACAF